MGRDSISLMDLRSLNDFILFTIRRTIELGLLQPRILIRRRTERDCLSIFIFIFTFFMVDVSFHACIPICSKSCVVFLVVFPFLFLPFPHEMAKQCNHYKKSIKHTHVFVDTERNPIYCPILMLGMTRGL